MQTSAGRPLPTEAELRKREAELNEREQRLQQQQKELGVELDKPKTWPVCYPVWRHSIGEVSMSWKRRRPHGTACWTSRRRRAAACVPLRAASATRWCCCTTAPWWGGATTPRQPPCPPASRPSRRWLPGPCTRGPCTRGPCTRGPCTRGAPAFAHHPAACSSHAAGHPRGLAARGARGVLLLDAARGRAVVPVLLRLGDAGLRRLWQRQSAVLVSHQ